MIDITLPKGFKVDDLYTEIAKGYNTKFIKYSRYKSKIQNIIGASTIPYGMRKNVLLRLLFRKKEQNNDMITGKIIHQALQVPNVITRITKRINQNLGLIEKDVNNNRFIQLSNGNYISFTTQPNIKKRKEKLLLIEISEGNYLRMHIDIYTSLYNIEIKTTTMPKEMWQDLAPYHLMQANLYTGFCNHRFGFILKVDKNFIKSKGKFPFIWNKYFFPYPYEFNQELFAFTLQRLHEFFGYLQENTNPHTISCPEFIFECGDCIVKDKCKNPIEKVKMEQFGTCVACGERIVPNTTAIIRNNELYHYTDGHRHRHENCIQKCKEDYLFKTSD